MISAASFARFGALFDGDELDTLYSDRHCVCNDVDSPCSETFTWRVLLDGSNCRKKALNRCRPDLLLQLNVTKS